MWWKMLGAVCLVYVVGRTLAGLLLPGALQSATGPDHADVEVRENGKMVQIRAERVSREAWGATWPFTVDEATLVCVPGLAEHGAFYVVDGSAYAANGASETMARIKSIDVVVNGKALRPVTLDAESPDGDRLWALSETSEQAAASGAVDRAWLARKDIGVLATEVRKLGCG